MGKKKIRKTQVSKGQRRSIVAGVKEVRAEKSPFEKTMNKIKAWKKGQNPWVTVPGPNTNMPFVKKRANEVWGDPRHVANIYRGKTADE
jgi:2'-5' RNA ligase